MSTKLVTSTFDTNTAELFVQDISTEPYYLFVGKHTPFTPDDQTLEQISNAVQITTSNAYNNMLFGRKISPDNASLVVPRYDWESGTVYAQYENTDESLLERNFYVSVKDGENFNVYKCLFNNYSANSTVQPSGQDLQPFTSPLDGYIWKYMYTYSSALDTRFSTSNSIPLVSNSAVTAAAVPGTIEVIQVIDSGKGYANYFNGTFRVQDILVNGADTQYGLTEDASNLNQFYKSCIIKITSGSGINQYQKIVDYTIANGRKVITLEDNFPITPSSTDTYQIYPSVLTVGDGTEQTNCISWAIINPVGNTISSVEVLDPGNSYRLAVSSVVTDNTVPISSNAVVSPIISPADGHGFDPAVELGAKQVCVSISFAGTESNTIPIDNDYRTIGIIKHPTFSNVEVSIDYSSQIGIFVPGETVHTFRSRLLGGTVALNLANVTVVGTNTSFSESLFVNDSVLVTDGVQNFITTIAAISNTTFLTLGDSPTWSNTGCSLSVISHVSNAELISANTETLVLNSVDPTFNSNDLYVIGDSSMTTVNINQSASPIISINDSPVSTFDLFLQLTKVTGSLSSGSFVEDETVSQDTVLNQTASLFSYTNGTPAYIYLTNISQAISLNDNIVGQSSGASFVTLNKYPGELTIDSGEIVYIENVSPISRDANKLETIKIILEF